MSATSSEMSIHALTEVLRKSTSEVLSQALSASWTVDPGDATAASGNTAETLAFHLKFSGKVAGDAVLILDKRDILFLAQKFLAEDVNPSAELSNDHQDATEELFRQVCGVAQTALSGQFGETKLELVRGDAATTGTSIYLLASDGTYKMCLQVQVSPELISALSGSAAKAVEKDKPRDELHPGKNAALLFGIDLEFSLRFGQNTLTLRELSALAHGSVVELDRQTHDPVELLLGDQLVAKGEVVVVEDNYGLRITEVCGMSAE